MTFLDFIGFLVAILAFLFLMAKQAKEQRRRREHPEEYEEEIREQEAALRKFMGIVDVEVKEEQPAPPPPPQKKRRPPHGLQPLHKDRLVTQQEMGSVFRRPHEEQGDKIIARRDEEVFRKPHEAERVQHEALGFRHEDAYKIQKAKKTPIQQFLSEPGSLRKGIILREVLGPPKALDR